MGVILYEMVTGRRPFESRNREELYDLIERDAVIPLRRILSSGEVNKDLDDICLKCLEKDPNHRYTTAGDLHGALRAWLDRYHNLPLIKQSVHEFERLIERYPASEFVGRVDVINQVRAILSRDDRGLIVIKGPPGKGKTALLTELARILPEASDCLSISFYYQSQADGRVGSDRPADCLRHICASLTINHKLAQSAGERLPTAADEMFDRLQKVLKDVGKRLSYGSRQFIFIDGLDEARDRAADLTAFGYLPQELPPHVYIITATRDHPDIPHARIVDMEHPDFKHQDREDGERYVEKSLIHLSPSADLIKRIAEVGDGNFLVLEHLCKEVGRVGCESEDTRELLSNLSNAPDRLARSTNDFAVVFKPGS